MCLRQCAPRPGTGSRLSRVGVGSCVFRGREPAGAAFAAAVAADVVVVVVVAVRPRGILGMLGMEV